ncbi:hypothetical protein NLG97_g7699 [Lecanicillium saksenae]|uniref:Uncharacterized protein n=1 Tax=Lecanicillium saksenae TaxID=468837 RepID=A0ACC1QM71_9HYPO|nr:hypothetical protein NLG97_g7699 [Lecanicillium saksenae]
MDQINWIITTKLPGTTAMGSIYRMSYPQRHRFVQDLTSIVKQINSIPNHTGQLICGAGGGRIYDWRCAMSFGCGPFNTEEAFNKHISKDSQVETYMSDAFETKYKSVFTHGDLHFCNILAHNGRLTGIVDWESAGFMPEYWDFKKTMRVKKVPDEIDIIRKIWSHKYDHELKVERRLWQGYPLGDPEET